MKSVKNSVFALLLVFAITSSVAAGEMPIPPAPEPAPRATAIAPAETTQPSDLGSVQSGDTESSDYLYFEALVALMSIY
jgi:hypothetical protein